MDGNLSVATSKYVNNWKQNLFNSFDSQQDNKMHTKFKSEKKLWKHGYIILKSMASTSSPALRVLRSSEAGGSSMRALAERRLNKRLLPC